MAQKQIKENLYLYLEIKDLISAGRLSLREQRQFHEDQYEILYDMYQNAHLSEDSEYTKKWVTKELIQYMIPILDRLLKRDLDDNLFKITYLVWEKCMALASRQSFHHFLLYMELDRTPDRQVYSNRLEVLRGTVFYLNKMHNEEQFMNLIASFSPSYGKCLHPDTPVLTPKGNIPIKDISVGDEVYSMKDKENVIQTVKNKWYSNKEQVKVTTRSGKEIVMSPEHKMFTDKGYKQAKDLTVEDYFYRLNGEIEPNEPNKIDYDKLVFLTGMLFDGHCKEDRLGFTSQDNSFARQFLKSCDNLGFNVTKHPKKGTDAINYRIIGKPNPAYQLLKEYNLHDKLSTKKRLPQQFFQMEIDQKFKFLGMLFATDGYISKNDVGISSSSEGLVDDLIIFLQTLGIFSIKSDRTTTCQSGKFKSWRLRIPNDIAIKLLPKLNMFHKDDDKEKVFNGTKMNRGNTFVRYPFSLLEGLEPKGKGGYHSKLRYERKNDRSPRMMERYFDVYPELEEHRYKDFFYEEIVDIEYIDKKIEMVDIEVSETHNFIANGYVSHNSFLVNYFSAWVLGNDTDGSILRLSYSDDLLNGFSRSIKGLILEQRFKDIFPYFEKFGNKPFSKDKASDWLIKGADTLVSHYTRTRDGSVTGVRAKSYIIFDDMTKGADEATNDTIHEKYWNQYTTEWRNRKENDKVKEITIGTMWNPKDILSRKGDQLDRNYASRQSKFKYTTEYLNEDREVVGVVIRVPLLDDELKSTCEDIYSTETALGIKEETDEFLFSCVYQQDPISPTGRLFAYDNLKQYEYVGNDLYHNGQRIELSEYAYASLDPVRKGHDFVSMPIFRYDVNNPHMYYLVDVMFQGKSMDEVYDEITSRVLQHDMNKLAIENNTDTSLAELIRVKLHDAGHYSCELIEKYNTVKKEQRIRDENLPIRQQIVFPKEGMYPAQSEMGRFMENITRFSLDRPNKNDDAPDSVALFVHEIIKEGYRGAKVEAIRRPDFM